MRKCILFSLLILSSFANADVENQVASTWLSLLDKGAYQVSWEKSAPYFQSEISENDWVSLVESARKPFGDFMSRQRIDSEAYSSLPNMPNGRYEVIRYSTTFANKINATETLTIMKVGEEWKAVGYFIN